MSGESSLWSGDVSTAPASMGPSVLLSVAGAQVTVSEDSLHLQRPIPFPLPFPCSSQARATPKFRYFSSSTPRCQTPSQHHLLWLLAEAIFLSLCIGIRLRFHASLASGLRSTFLPCIILTQASMARSYSWVNISRIEPGASCTSFRQFQRDGMRDVAKALVQHWLFETMSSAMQLVLAAISGFAMNLRGRP